VVLDDRYKFVDSLDGLGVPSLAKCRKLEVLGEVVFEEGVVIDGSASFGGGEKIVVSAGVYP